MGRPKAKESDASQSSSSASELISSKLAELGDWRADTLGRIRTLIRQAAPDVVEELKWRGTPVWSHDGIICTGESYKKVVKLTFAKGAALEDPARLFNSSLDGNTRRAIDLREGEEVPAPAFKALVREAVALNRSGRKGRGKGGRATTAKSKARVAAKPVLLSGGNPQIAKGDGDGPVQAYIAAMPGWKSALGRRLDALIARTLGNVTKAVKWNSPFYGIEGRGWFLSLHCYTKYVKVAFFRGTSLRPIPPGASRHKEVRYLDIHEDDQLDEELLARWLRQAAALPGWVP